MASNSSSFILTASISSDARIIFARVNICFSPVDRPFSDFPDREVAPNLGELVDVAGVDLVAIVLEPVVPFLGISEPASWSTANTFLTVSSSVTRRRPASAAFVGRDHHGHVVVQDLSSPVLAALAQDLPDFLADHLTDAVVRVNDSVSDLELDTNRCLRL